MICNLFLLLMGGWCILSISLCQPLPAVGYPFDCPNIVYLIAFPNKSNSQAELSKPNRDFNISKRKRTRSPSEYISTYQSSLQCDVCISNHLVTRSVTKGGLRPHGKTPPPEKMSWTYCMHNHCFRICYRCKIWASLRKFFVPWCPKLDTGLLVTVALWLLSVMPLSSAFSQSNFSDLTLNFNRRH